MRRTCGYGCSKRGTNFLKVSLKPLLKDQIRGINKDNKILGILIFSHSFSTPRCSNPHTGTLCLSKWEPLTTTIPTNFPKLNQSPDNLILHEILLTTAGMVMVLVFQVTIASLLGTQPQSMYKETMVLLKVLLRRT